MSISCSLKILAIVIRKHLETALGAEKLLFTEDIPGPVENCAFLRDGTRNIVPEIGHSQLWALCQQASTLAL
jgi:hypothetical protein